MERNKKYNYFYRITNTVNGKYYYGVHSTDDIDDGYMGSGEKLKLAIKKHGIENFVKDILVYFDSANEMYEYERSVVDMDKVRDRRCYNCKQGGIGGCYPISEETRKKMSEAKKGKPAWNRGIPWSEETRQKISESLKGKPGPNKGKPVPEKTRKKISESMKGRHLSEETRQNMSGSRKGNPAWNKGKRWYLDPTTNRRTYY